ncbi:MAG: helix-turn-helix family protein [Caulobacteraceae bacterium]|nr:helix-turn-helix family protein [Caulobacteraceae bacterium]
MAGTSKGVDRTGNRLAVALRELRQRDGLTLADVSRRTGLSVSSLSKVENGQMLLTYDKLASLASGMGVDITFFFSAHGPLKDETAAVTARRSINRKGEGERVNTRFYDYLYPCADLSNRRLLPMIGTVKARTLEQFGGLVSHDGEEFTTVLEGRVEVQTEFYGPTVLEVGDSIYFDSTMGHAYLAASDGPCRILCVATAPEKDPVPALRDAVNDKASAIDWSPAAATQRTYAQIPPEAEAPSKTKPHRPGRS